MLVLGFVMKNIRIAVLGATGQIGRCLVAYFSKTSDVVVFGRSSGQSYDTFMMGHYDLVINAVGYGDIKHFTDTCQLDGSIYDISDRYDRMVLAYLEVHPDTVYVHLSSGAVYGADFYEPANECTFATLDVNHMSYRSAYQVSKLYAEARHRLLSGLRIWDIRIFGFVSPYQDLGSSLLFSQIMCAIRDQTQLVVDHHDMLRDYIHPDDLGRLVSAVFQSDCRNGVVDAMSASPISKLDLLAACESKYGLRYRVEEKKMDVVTGLKPMYYSMYRASELDWAPRYTSLESVKNAIGLAL